MKVFKVEEINKIKENVSCIGYFDGVHLGHQRLIEETIKEARRLNVSANVITFYPDPETVVSKKEVKELTSLKRRLELFEEYGIENVLLLEFNEELMCKDKESFINDYIVSSNVNTLVCGFDFHFGYKASGNVSDLKRYKEFNTIEISEVKDNGEKISSTRIRKLIEDGDIKEAKRLMGHE